MWSPRTAKTRVFFMKFDEVIGKIFRNNVLSFKKGNLQVTHSQQKTAKFESQSYSIGLQASILTIPYSIFFVSNIFFKFRSPMTAAEDCIWALSILSPYLWDIKPLEPAYYPEWHTPMLIPHSYHQFILSILWPFLYERAFLTSPFLSLENV